jgi:hypothetical protein
MTRAARTTYDRAARGYDAAFNAALQDAIATAIFDTSRVTDANAVAIRTTETTDALVVALAGVLALRPEARVPSQLRHLVGDIARRLRRNVAQFRSDEEFRSAVAGWFDDSEQGGTA